MSTILVYDLHASTPARETFKNYLKGRGWTDEHICGNFHCKSPDSTLLTEKTPTEALTDMRAAEVAMKRADLSAVIEKWLMGEFYKTGGDSDDKRPFSSGERLLDRVGGSPRTIPRSSRP